MLGLCSAGETKPEPDRSNAHEDAANNVQQGKAGLSAPQKGERLQAERREGCETTEDTGDQEQSNRLRDRFPGKSAYEQADQKTAQTIDSEGGPRKAIRRRSTQRDARSMTGHRADEAAESYPQVRVHLCLRPNT